MTKRELIEENEMLKEVLQSWLDVDMLDLVPSYEDNRDLRNEKSKAVINQEMYSMTINNLRDENVRLKVQLDEDGELMNDEVQSKIIRHVLDIGDWKLMRRKMNES